MTKKRCLRIWSSCLFLILLTCSAAYANLQQALQDGQAGQFKEASKFLSEQAERLEQQLNQPDIFVAGRNCAAIGFNMMLIRVASDCIDEHLSPEQGKILYAAAKQAAEGQLAKASSLAEQVTSALPDYAPGYLIKGRILMGRCLQENVDCEKVIATLRKAFEIDPDLTAARFDLAMLYLNLKDKKSAMAEYEAACSGKADPTVAKWSHFMLALFYSDKEQWAKAKQHADQAKSMGLSISDKLIAKIERYVSDKPTPSKSVSDTASMMTTKQLYDAALKSAIKEDFTTAKDYLATAKIKDSSNMPVAIALSLAECAADKKISADAGICVFKSIQAGNTKNWDESLAQAKKASQLDPNCAPIFLHLGTVYVGLVKANRGDNYAHDAINAYTRAIELDDKNGLAYYNLGVAQAAFRQWKSARQNLLKAKSLEAPVPPGLIKQVENQM
jgi:tetratricopeptide (TPR) repeat protein